MQRVRVEVWLRVQRELLAAERAYSEKLSQYADGKLSEDELKAAKEVLQARRELANAVTDHAWGPPPRDETEPKTSSSDRGETEGR
jgi:hypothetical protein